MTSENKTKPSGASVQSYLHAIDSEERRADCVALCGLMEKATKQKPAMWGPNIVGFGTYHYRYESGREGDACAVGFSSRKSEISIYLVAESAQQKELLARLGRHKMGKACLRIRKLTDIDLKVLRALVIASVEEVRRRYG